MYAGVSIFLRQYTNPRSQARNIRMHNRLPDAKLATMRKRSMCCLLYFCPSCFDRISKADFPCVLLSRSRSSSSASLKNILRPRNEPSLNPLMSYFGFGFSFFLILSSKRSTHITDLSNEISKEQDNLTYCDDIIVDIQKERKKRESSLIVILSVF